MLVKDFELKIKTFSCLFQATDAYCLLDIYNLLCSCYTADYIQSFRGKKPKKLDSAIVRQIDENFADTNNNNLNQPPSMPAEATRVCSRKKEDK